MAGRQPELKGPQKRGSPMKRVTVTVDPADYAVLEQMVKDGDVSAPW